MIQLVDRSGNPIKLTQKEFADVEKITNIDQMVFNQEKDIRIKLKSVEVQRTALRKKGVLI